MIPKAFFVTSGKALSNVSKLNTFDLALKEAGIAQCNLVKVSSIIPPSCIEAEPKDLPAGAFTYVVLSKADGEGETISAGIAWGVEKNNGYGVVAETYGKMDEATARKKLDKKIAEMAKIRGIELGEKRYRIETLDVPKNSHGCVVAALVYLF
ncbi:MAG: pyruvoyl-dependent arginine decarboxylase [Candidatus Bathyarchaeota archaeon]|nr:pyruvoyl-dependent arginine decarboxylase [Candidatus Bathyarchaeota archaeon]